MDNTCGPKYFLGFKVVRTGLSDFHKTSLIIKNYNKQKQTHSAQEKQIFFKTNFQE